MGNRAVEGRVSAPLALAAIAAPVVLAVLAGCGGPSARIMRTDEPSLVDTQRAGPVVQRQLIDEALKKLSAEYRARTRGQPTFTRIRMSFVGVENATNEELGSLRQQMNDIVNQAIYNSGDFTDLSFRNFVQPAMDEAGVGMRQLGMPRYQRELAGVLERQGNPLDSLLFARLTQGDARAGNIRQSDYLLQFELVNLADGTRVLSTAEVRKEYVR